MSRTPPPTDPFEMDDAAYVLGALSPVERSRYEQHLQTCSVCAHAVAELAGLPGMLRRLPIEVVESLEAASPHEDDLEAPAPPTLLAGVMRRVELEERRERRTRVTRWATALTVGAAAVTVGILALVGPEAPAPAPSAEQEPPPTSQLSFEPLVDTGLSAQVSLREVAWGTKIQLECAYPDQGVDDRWSDASGYSLVVHDREGDSQQVATWNAVAGRELTIDAATAVREDDIASFEVRAMDGTAILRSVS